MNKYTDPQKCPERKAIKVIRITPGKLHAWIETRIDGKKLVIRKPLNKIL